MTGSPPTDRRIVTKYDALGRVQCVGGEHPEVALPVEHRHPTGVMLQHLGEGRLERSVGGHRGLEGSDVVGHTVETGGRAGDVAGIDPAEQPTIGVDDEGPAPPPHPRPLRPGRRGFGDHACLLLGNSRGM